MGGILLIAFQWVLIYCVVPIFQRIVLWIWYYLHSMNIFEYKRKTYLEQKEYEEKGSPNFNLITERQCFWSGFTARMMITTNGWEERWWSDFHSDKLTAVDVGPSTSTSTSALSALMVSIIPLCPSRWWYCFLALQRQKWQTNHLKVMWALKAIPLKFKKKLFGLNCSDNYQESVKQDFSSSIFILFLLPLLNL